MPALNELYLPELICWIFNCIQLMAQQPNLSNIYCSLYLAPSFITLAPSIVMSVFQVISCKK